MKPTTMLGEYVCFFQAPNKQIQVYGELVTPLHLHGSLPEVPNGRVFSEKGAFLTTKFKLEKYRPFLMYT